MTETNRLANRIPFEEIESFSSWKLPSLGEGKEVVSSVRRKKTPRVDPPVDRAVRQGESVEDLAEAPEARPITAAQLEEMAAQAEQEGREAGYAEGYKQGMQAGEQKGRKLGEQKAYQETSAELQEKRDQFMAMAEALMEPLAIQDSSLENLVLNMAVSFAQHIVAREVAQDPSILYAAVEKAIAALPVGVDNVRVYLHPEDTALAQQAFADNGRAWRFLADGGLSRGGCRVESDQSLVDFAIETRVKALLEEASYSADMDPEELPPMTDYRPQTEPQHAGGDTEDTDGLDGNNNTNDSQTAAPPQGNGSPTEQQQDFTGSEANPTFDSEPNPEQANSQFQEGDWQAPTQQDHANGNPDDSPVDGFQQYDENSSAPAADNPSGQDGQPYTENAYSDSAPQDPSQSSFDGGTQWTDSNANITDPNGGSW